MAIKIISHPLLSVLSFDEERQTLMCNLGYTPYIPKEVLSSIKELIDVSIKFAENNDVEKLNNDYISLANTGLLNHKKDHDCKKPKKNGFIYIIKDPIRGLHKIGYSTNLQKRFKQFRTIIPNMEVILDIPNSDYERESFIHKLFEQKKIGGEWFQLDKKDIDYVKQIFNL